MANRRRSTTRYESYGSVAYSPVYEGNTVRVPKREEEYQPVPQPRRREQQHPRRRQFKRAQVEVRQPGAVAPFAVVGFLAVAVLAALLLFSHARCTELNGEIVNLRGELARLNAENATLSAQYEQVFDMSRIQASTGGAMVRPADGQAVYIDLSEPDAVVVFDGLKDNRIMDALIGVGETLGEMIEYFR